VATFACIRLIRKGAMLPSLHSPNTHTVGHILLPSTNVAQNAGDSLPAHQSLCAVDGGSALRSLGSSQCSPSLVPVHLLVIATLAPNVPSLSSFQSEH
jgi:hypothetical protein